jgi:hypothetical protein
MCQDRCSEAHYAQGWLQKEVPYSNPYIIKPEAKKTSKTKPIGLKHASSFFCVVTSF